jgi:hypothetical protein
LYEQLGVLRLQFLSGRFGPFEYPGKFTRDSSGTQYQFSFGEGNWYATATQSADRCLTVRYNTDMLFSDFEDGRYCPSPGGL